jgi:putative membrane protein
VGDAVVHSRLHLLILLWPGVASAHQPGEHAAAFAWNFEPWVVASLLASLALYAIGVRRLWAKAGTGRGVSRLEAALFGAGWMVLAIALCSPVDTLGGELFSMHMLQHELLMVAAAPLFVLARPLEAWAWGLPRAWAAGVAGFARRPVVEATWRALTEPVGAWILHAAAIWIWHIPPLFEIALRHEGVHALQHSTFLGSALFFWWSVLQPRGKPGGLAIASLFTTMLHTGALGALLTFGPRPWYTAYESTGHFGLTLLEDQQLGGLLMWVPGGTAYLLGGLLVAYGLLGPSGSAGRNGAGSFDYR